MFRENVLLGDGNDNVAGYNNRTSGMKPAFVSFVLLLMFYKLNHEVHKNGSRETCHIENKTLLSVLFCKHLIKFSIQKQRTI